MKPALIVFDIDGTLFRTELVTAPAVQRTFAAHGLPEPDAAKICSFFGRPNEEYLAWLASMCAPEQAAAIIDEVNRLEIDLIAKEGKLYPGVREMLTVLKNDGHILGICSNGPEDYVQKFLDAHDLRRFFDIVRTRGERYDGKKDMLGEILETIPARPVIVVGDRHDDIAAARAHGAWAIGARYGFGGAAEVQDADVQVNSAGEITAAVRKLLAR